MKPYRNILCATDFSSFSDRACIHAKKLAKKSGATLTLIHVVDHFPVDRSNAEIAPEDVDPKVVREQKVRKELEAQTARTDCAEARHEVTFSTQAPEHEIARCVGANGVDLIVVASHGHKGITALLGSTAKAVQHHATCEVIVVPGRGRSRNYVTGMTAAPPRQRVVSVAKPEGRGPVCAHHRRYDDWLAPHQAAYLSGGSFRGPFPTKAANGTRARV